MAKQPLLIILFMFMLLTRTHSLQHVDFHADSHKYQFHFDMTVSNVSNTTTHLVNVGMSSKVRFGAFTCLGGAAALTPLATYVIPFDVSKEETIINAIPPLEIEPHHGARFTVAYVPNAIHACGPWEADVSAILIFDDGEKLYSRIEHITDTDIEEYNNVPIAGEDIQRALKHHDPHIRSIATSRIPDATLDRKAQESLLRSALQDESPEVRIQAAKATATLGITDLSSTIATLLTHTNNNAEMTAYCDALGVLGTASTSEALVSAMTNLTFKNPARAGAALIRLQEPSVVNKLRPLLTQYQQWAATGAPEQQLTHYLAICTVLIRYRDMESINDFRMLLTQPQFAPIAERLVEELRVLLAGHAQKSDPFLKALANILDQTGRATK